MPTEEDVRAWASATEVDVENLLALYRRATHEFETFRRAFAGDPASHQASYGVAERAASVLFCYEPLVVHGLLQTPEYARALLHLPGGPVDHGATADQIDSMVAERMRRAAILYEPGRAITVLIGEASLRNQVGSSDVMQQQREHIARLVRTVSHARIGLIPFQRYPILSLHGWEQRDDIVSVETTAGDLDIADPAEVQQYKNWAQLLEEAAIIGDPETFLIQTR